jgi:hypothetical protein
LWREASFGHYPRLRNRMRLLQPLGVLLFVPGALALFLLLKEGAQSYLVYPAAVSNLGLALALYATVILWTDD